MNGSIIAETLADNAIRSTFGWTDYLFFFAMLCISAIIGVYFGFLRKNQETTTEYLLGGKTMGYFPIAMSLTASHLSGNTLLGVPSEVYQFGTQYAAVVVTLTFIGLITAYIFLPVFHKLQLTSTFEYLELRYSRFVRQFTSVLYIINLFLHTPILIYVPALAISQVTGFGLYQITPVICIVCIFYTTVGGLKALVWTDTIQFIVTLIILFIVLTISVVSVGGFAEIWKISEEGGRLIVFNMDPSPFVRTSFWGMALGITSSWIAGITLNQSTMQRFLAVPTMSDAKKAIFISCVGLIVVKLLSVLTGLIMYAKYHECDPMTTKVISRPDQMLPYYLMDVAENLPGLTGLFMAALVSSALSAMSSGLNTVAGIIWEDFISPWVPESESKERTATKMMKVTVVILGVIYASLVFVVEHLGEVFAMTTSLSSVTSGTIAGLFTLGVLVPWSNNSGAVIGGITGFVTTGWIVFGAQIHKVKGNIRYDELPISTENCPFPLNMTTWTKPTRPPIEPENEPFLLFNMSFLYFALVGYLTVIIIGTLISFLTGASNLDELNRDHFTPIIRRFLPREKYSEVPMTKTKKKQPVTQYGEKKH